MTETPRFALPLVAPAQAQKHVTVNEALARVDLLSQLSLSSVSTATPPATAVDGAAYFVPDAATDAWAGQDGLLALHIGGGWVFSPPQIGMRGWIEDEARLVLWSGSAWEGVGLPRSTSGSGLELKCVEIDHSIGTGAASTTIDLIPEGALVFAVTGRVVSAITGGAASFELGIAGVSADRYGSGIGVGAGSWLRGVTSSPVGYYADTPLTLTAQGGTFTGGIVRLVAHFAEFTLPSA